MNAKKVVKVNYPKKKPRLRLEDLGDVSEPERRSMYQVLQDNLKLANRATFLHRVIYVGSHKFPSYDYAKKVFEGIIRRCNESYCIDKLSGFLLYYPQYFVHMIEGDEDNLNKHIGFLLDEETEQYQYLGIIKLLIHVSNINQRFFDTWISFTGVPSKLLERLDLNADLHQSGRIIFNCIKKLYSLFSSFADDLTNTTEVSTLKEKHFTEVSVSSNSQSSGSFQATSLFLSSHESNLDYFDHSESTTMKDYKMFLPEYELLEFVIQSYFTMKLHEYYDLYGVVPMRDIYKDKVWPVPHDFIPYDVFEKPYDCLIELPKQLRGKQISDASSKVPSVRSFSEGDPSILLVDAVSNCLILEESN